MVLDLLSDFQCSKNMVLVVDGQGLVMEEFSGVFVPRPH